MRGGLGGGRGTRVEERWRNIERGESRDMVTVGARKSGGVVIPYFRRGARANPRRQSGHMRPVVGLIPKETE